MHDDCKFSILLAAHLLTLFLFVDSSQQGEAGVRQQAARPRPPRPWGSGGRHRSSNEHRRPAAAQADWNKQTEGCGASLEFCQNHRWHKPESGMLKLNSRVVVSGGGPQDLEVMTEGLEKI